MAGGTGRGKAQAGAKPAPPPAPRHPGLLRPLGAVLPAVTRPVFRKEGALLGTLLADWPAVIGPALAAVTTPRRLAAGTLVLGCAGPVALELQHLATQLAERINAHLGRPAVQRLRFVQQASANASARPPRPAPVRRPTAPPPVAGVPDGPLREALRALGAALAAEQATGPA